MFFKSMLVIVLFNIGTILALDSVKLKDVIDSKGIGEINVLKNISITELESFRLDCSGNLIFAVDVNEAASGTEKSTSQGITLKVVKLVIEFNDNTTKIFSQFHTQTQALVAAENEENRTLYYTMLGNTGSNRITSNKIKSQFDSALEIEVQQSLLNANSVMLIVELLQTNVSLGDPEAFYDFSNGFEDVAIINSTDANYLVVNDFGQEEAPVVIEVFPDAVEEDNNTVISTIYYPSSNTFCTVAFEDLYPSRGDYDFNDLIVNYRVMMGLNSEGNVIKISGVSYLIARGAGLDSNFHLRIESEGYSFQGNAQVIRTNPISLNTSNRSEILEEIDLVLFESTKTIFSSNEGFAFTNTDLASSFKVGPKSEFNVYLSQPVPISAFSAVPFDPYIYLPINGLEVHLPNKTPTLASNNYNMGFTSFLDNYGYPFAILIPEEWSYPIEYVNLTEAYPRFIDHVLSGQSTDSDWYQFPVDSKTKKNIKDQWKW